MAAPNGGDNPDQMMAALQLEKAELEVKKLRKDAASHWYDPVMALIPIITAVVTVAGFWWGILQYKDQQEQNRASQEHEAHASKETAERQFMEPWLKSQRETYAEALAAATTIANTNDAMKRKQSIEAFFALYHGKMILVETKSVSATMVRFGRCLDGIESCTKDEMNTRCRALATAMAESMAATAKMTFDQFAGNQFKYSSGN